MTLRYEKLTPLAFTPFRASRESAGFDLASPYSYNIEAGNVCKIYTDLAFSFPYGCYGRIAIRSSLALQGVNVIGGVIDRDFTGNVVIIVINHSKKDVTIDIGQRVAQIICEKIIYPNAEETQESLCVGEGNERKDEGFGSSGKYAKFLHNL